MIDQERAELNERSNTLRLTLKAWERDFAAANGGRKASRDEVKNNKEIDTKYKEYYGIRDTLSGKPPKPLPVELKQTPRKRRHEEPGHGVSKRQQITNTPSKTPSKGTSMKPWEIDPYSPPLVRSLFTPSKKALGPTPQKDGVVLGIFDLLQEDSPSKPGDKEQKKENTIEATPRKAGRDVQHGGRHTRTPSSKRFLIEGFTTPLKNRDLNGQEGKTPSSVSRFHFSTPSFLRRDSQRIQLGPVNENDPNAELSPQMVRLPRKPIMRGLSSILAGLRKIEEDAADEDLEALREMEEEEAGISKPAKPKKSVPAPDKVLVADSQPGFPLGAFDDEAQYDSQIEEKDKGLGPDGQPLKIYKKKGQKRTTRRVKMKPTRSKPQGEPKDRVETEPGSEDELAVEAVPETQVDDDDEAAGFADARNYNSDTQSEYTASEGGTRYKRANQTKKNKLVNRDGKIKTAARKVNAMAHQNFKRLKLRNSGAKGGPAHNSRFRRKK